MGASTVCTLISTWTFLLCFLANRTIKMNTQGLLSVCRRTGEAYWSLDIIGITIWESCIDAYRATLLWSPLIQRLALLNLLISVSGSQGKLEFEMLPNSRQNDSHHCVQTFVSFTPYNSIAMDTSWALFQKYMKWNLGKSGNVYEVTDLTNTMRFKSTRFNTKAWTLYSLVLLIVTDGKTGQTSLKNINLCTNVSLNARLCARHYTFGKKKSGN